MNINKTTAVIALAIFVIGCGEKANKEPEKEPPVARTAASPAPAASDTRQREPVVVITSVHAQWIISDSMPKAEITLIGEHLAPNPNVTSGSPQMKVETIDPDPGRTLIIVGMDMASPAGDYELQYQAPGQDPIPFTIRYAGMK